MVKFIANTEDFALEAFGNMEAGPDLYKGEKTGKWLFTLCTSDGRKLDRQSGLATWQASDLQLSLLTNVFGQVPYVDQLAKLLDLVEKKGQADLQAQLDELCDKLHEFIASR